MGIKKTRHIDSDQTRESYRTLLNIFKPIIKPYFNFNGKIDLSQYDPTYETSNTLAGMLDCQIALKDANNAIYFCADDILAKQIIIEENNMIKFWGIVYWLETPKDYEINKTGQDPFYAEFKLKNGVVSIIKMKCGDYNLTNLDKVWWFDLDLNWIFELDLSNDGFE